MEKFIWVKVESNLKKDQQYEVFEKGEKIIDSYTNEVIGNVETSVSKN